jgi:serine protease inhibitor
MVIHTTTAYADTAGTIADFSQKLIDKTPQGQSVWLSPVGIIMALGILLGATSKKDELLNALELRHLRERDIHHLFGSYMNQFNHDGQPTLSMKNEMIRDSINPINPAFLDLMTRIYKASIKNTAPPGTVSLIVTNGFKGLWREAFDPENSAMRSFHVTPSQQIDVAMMYQRMEKCRYFKGATCEVLALPYGSDDGRFYEKVFFLPSRSYSLGELEPQLTFPFIEQCLKNAAVTKVDVTLPMLDMKNTLDLKNTLSQMGIPVEAELTGMGANWFIENITHEAFGIDHETGSEAGSKTIMDCALRSYESTYEAIPEVVLNRPYHHMIIVHQKNREGRSIPLILFRGRVADATPLVKELPPRVTETLGLEEWSLEE